MNERSRMLARDVVEKTTDQAEKARLEALLATAPRTGSALVPDPREPR